MRLTKNGWPENPIIKQKTIPDKIKYPTKVRDHPEWSKEDKPWGGYPHRDQHYSIEMHYLYRRALELGVGNYANLGTFRGGSTSAIAHGLRKIGGGKVYAVDLFNGVNGSLSIKELKDIFKERKTDSYVEFCQGFTHEWPKRLKDLKFKFIFIDADHHYETCKQDFELWSQLLESDGQIAFHDVNINTVDMVLQEIKDEWELVDHICKIKSFKRK